MLRPSDHTNATPLTTIHWPNAPSVAASTRNSFRAVRREKPNAPKRTTRPKSALSPGKFPAVSKHGIAMAVPHMETQSASSKPEDELRVFSQTTEVFLQEVVGNEVNSDDNDRFAERRRPENDDTESLSNSFAINKPKCGGGREHTAKGFGAGLSRSGVRFRVFMRACHGRRSLVRRVVLSSSPLLVWKSPDSRCLPAFFFRVLFFFLNTRPEGPGSHPGISNAFSIIRPSTRSIAPFWNGDGRTSQSPAGSSVSASERSPNVGVRTCCNNSDRRLNRLLPVQ